MAGFRWIKVSLFLMLVLQFTAAGQLFLSRTVRVGEDVTLSCENVLDDQSNCDSTKWNFADARGTITELIRLGQVRRLAKAKSDRLDVTKNCSLVIKEVEAEDAGRYFCEQFKSEVKQGQDARVLLSVVTMTEEKNTDQATLRCSVLTYEPCRHAVKWDYNSRGVERHNNKTPCSASVTFPTADYMHTSWSNLFTCVVSNDNKVQKFPFSLRLPGKRTTATTRATDGASTELKACSGCPVLNYIMLVLRVAELVLITVITVLLFRARGNQRPPDDNTADLRSNGLHLTALRNRDTKKVNNDEDDDVVRYEIFGDSSASGRGNFHINIDSSEKSLHCS